MKDKYLAWIDGLMMKPTRLIMWLTVVVGIPHLLGRFLDLRDLGAFVSNTLSLGICALGCTYSLLKTHRMKREELAGLVPGREGLFYCQCYDCSQIFKTRRRKGVGASIPITRDDGHFDYVWVCLPCGKGRIEADKFRLAVADEDDF